VVLKRTKAPPSILSRVWRSLLHLRFQVLYKGLSRFLGFKLWDFIGQVLELFLRTGTRLKDRRVQTDVRSA
jgi:hypothetical protein